MRWVYLVFLFVGVVQSSTLYQWIIDSKTSFNYDPNPNNMLGVYNWPRTYSEDCGGFHQSPVDIQTDFVRYGASCQCPTMIYQSNILRGTFKNNGHSAEFEPEDEPMLQLTDVPHRTGTYKLHDFHLHYGGVTGRDFELQGLRFRGSGVMSAGSEHTIDGLRFEGELHFVFYNSKYKDLEEADNKTDGVVVICILIQKLQGSMSDSSETSRFSEFIEMNVPRIFPYQANASTEVDFSMFFNRDCEFYTYPGSTTTPTCHESVRWIILKDPIMVTERAWFRLTGLQSRGDFNSRFGNYRTTQPLNDRVIEANFDRPNGPVLPSPNGDAMMMMMLDVMNMTMEMMNPDANTMNNNPNLQDIPMMLMQRTDLSPEGNVRDIPLMMMAMVQNANVPNLNGNVRGMPPLMPIEQTNQLTPMEMRRDGNVPNLNGNLRQMPMMLTPMQRNGNVPNLNGNVRQMPMMLMPTERDGNVPNLNGNVRQMARMLMPMPMQRDGNIPNFNGNERQMQMMSMMPSLKDGNAPNLNGNARQMMISQLNSPYIPNLFEMAKNTMPNEIMSMMMPQDRSVQNIIEIGLPMSGQMQVGNRPNPDGSVRGRTIMRMPSRPIFDQNALRMMPRDMPMGMTRGIPNSVQGELTQRFSDPSQTASRQTFGSINSNRNNNRNNEDNRNNSNNRNRNTNNNNRNYLGQNMRNAMQSLQPLLWNLWA